jgi:hypothetical protein
MVCKRGLSVSTSFLHRRVDVREDSEEVT